MVSPAFLKSPSEECAAKKWPRNSFLGAVRTRTSLSISVREAAICRVAVLNRAWYEWGHHAPLLLSDPSMTQEHVDAVRHSSPRDASGSVLDEQLQAVLEYADAMTLDVSVPNHVFERLKKNFSEKEVVEITATVAAYNCVSRFLVALDVGEKNEQDDSTAR